MAHDLKIWYNVILSLAIFKVTIFVVPYLDVVNYRILHNILCSLVGLLRQN